MRLGAAIEALEDGHSVARAGWNGKGMYISYQLPTPKSKITRPYLYITDADGELVPWLASQTDLLANDYCIVDVT